MPIIYFTHSPFSAFEVCTRDGNTFRPTMVDFTNGSFLADDISTGGGDGDTSGLPVKCLTYHSCTAVEFFTRRKIRNTFWPTIIDLTNKPFFATVIVAGKRYRNAFWKPIIYFTFGSCLAMDFFTRVQDSATSGPIINHFTNSSFFALDFITGSWSRHAHGPIINNFTNAAIFAA